MGSRNVGTDGANGALFLGCYCCDRAGSLLVVRTPRACCRWNSTMRSPWHWFFSRALSRAVYRQRCLTRCHYTRQVVHPVVLRMPRVYVTPTLTCMLTMQVSQFPLRVRCLLACNSVQRCAWFGRCSVVCRETADHTSRPTAARTSGYRPTP